jgi:hypothetical protein
MVNVKSKKRKKVRFKKKFFGGIDSWIAEDYTINQNLFLKIQIIFSLCPIE